MTQRSYALTCRHAKKKNSSAETGNGVSLHARAHVVLQVNQSEMP